MKILMVLTNAFDPDPRVYKEARSLVGIGHSVDIFCWDRESRYTDKPVEILDGIRIIRFFSQGAYGTGYKQLKGYLSFCKATMKYALQNKFDAVHSHDFDALIIGRRIQKRLKIQLVFDEHDFFHLYFRNRHGWINQRIADLVLCFQKHILQNVRVHIVVTPQMKAFYETDGGSESKATIRIITNAPMKESFAGIRTKENHKKPVIGFVGTIRYLDELKILIKVAADYPGIGILIAGKGRALEPLLQFQNEQAVSNVEITGEYTLEQLEEIYAGIDVTYLIYPPSDSEISLPNKFFESIITETPIIADSKAEYGQMVRSLGIGWTVESQRIEESLRTIFKELDSDPKILDKYKENMRRIKEDYFWESNIPLLREIYEMSTIF